MYVGGILMTKQLEDKVQTDASTIPVTNDPRFFVRISDGLKAAALILKKGVTEPDAVKYYQTVYRGLEQPSDYHTVTKASTTFLHRGSSDTCTLCKRAGKVGSSDGKASLGSKITHTAITDYSTTEDVIREGLKSGLGIPHAYSSIQYGMYHITVVFCGGSGGKIEAALRLSDQMIPADKSVRFQVLKRAPGFSPGKPGSLARTVKSDLFSRSFCDMISRMNGRKFVPHMTFLKGIVDVPQSTVLTGKMTTEIIWLPSPSPYTEDITSYQQYWDKDGTYAPSEKEPAPTEPMREGDTNPITQGGETTDKQSTEMVREVVPSGTANTDVATDQERGVREGSSDENHRVPPTGGSNA
jgi:hypothetical protein